MEVFIEIILLITLLPWGRLSHWQKWVQGVFPGGKCSRCVGLTTLPPSCAVVKKSGNLNFLKPSGPLQACNGTALPLLLGSITIVTVNFCLSKCNWTEVNLFSNRVHTAAVVNTFISYLFILQFSEYLLVHLQEELPRIWTQCSAITIINILSYFSPCYQLQFDESCQCPFCLFLLDMNGIIYSIILLSTLLTRVYRILLIFYKFEIDQIYNFYKISVLNLCT
jgi:hypothetical protein